MSQVLVINAPSKSEAEKRLAQMTRGKTVTIRVNAAHDRMRYRPVPRGGPDCKHTDFDYTKPHVIVAIVK